VFSPLRRQERRSESSDLPSESSAALELLLGANSLFESRGERILDIQWPEFRQSSPLRQREIFERGRLELLTRDGAGQRFRVVGVNPRVVTRAAQRYVELAAVDQPDAPLGIYVDDDAVHGRALARVRG
jgi:hypothetical protein